MFHELLSVAHNLRESDGGCACAEAAGRDFGSIADARKPTPLLCSVPVGFPSRVALTMAFRSSSCKCSANC
eukprot:19905-Heterococcus_DN1.PRE.2